MADIAATELEANVLAFSQAHPFVPWTEYYGGPVRLTVDRLVKRGWLTPADTAGIAEDLFKTTPAGDAALAAWLAANP